MKIDFYLGPMGWRCDNFWRIAPLVRDPRRGFVIRLTWLRIRVFTSGR